MIDRLFSAILYILEYIYFCLVKLRNLLYDKNIIKTKKADVAVFGIGNITTGGTGKTPVVEKAALDLKTAGKKIIIISRGYGGQARTPAIVSSENQIFLNCQQAGDEPYMLAEKLPGIPVIIGKNRFKAYQLAARNFQFEAILLDDAFQHRSIFKNREIVVINCLQPFGYNHLLPGGFLREPLSSLGRGDIFILNHYRHVSESRVEKIKETIYSYNKKADIVLSSYRPAVLIDIISKKRFEPDFLRGKKVVILAAIGSPASFIKDVKKTGVRVVDSFIFKDHHRYSTEDIKTIVDKVKLREIDYMVTTEKDAVKLTEKSLHVIEVNKINLLVLLSEMDFQTEINWGQLS